MAPNILTGARAEPSLIAPGIIISFMFSKRQRLVFRTTPLQNQFACPEEPVDNASNWLGVQISAENFPRSTGGCLFVLQQVRLHQPFDRAVTHTTYPSSFVQTNSLRIG